MAEAQFGQENPKNPPPAMYFLISPYKLGVAPMQFHVGVNDRQYKTMRAAEDRVRVVVGQQWPALHDDGIS